MVTQCVVTDKCRISLNVVTSISVSAAARVWRELNYTLNALGPANRRLE
jgi:hypothetical protein